MSDDSRPASPGRRRMLRGAAAAGLVATAAAAEQIARPAPAQATNGDPVLLGSSNGATNTTQISDGTPGDMAFLASAFGAGSIGGAGYTDLGTGVKGFSDSSGTGVTGSSNSGIGVQGVSDSNWGVFASSTTNTGLQAGSTSGDAVVATSTSGTGVYAQSGSTNGYAVTRDAVRGFTDSATAAGVRGENAGGGPGLSGGGSVGVQAQAIGIGATALEVLGPAVFSRSGLLTIAAGASAVTQTGVHLTAASLVLATLQQNQAGLYVTAAVPKPGAASSFTIHLNKAAPKAATVAWFVIN